MGRDLTGDEAAQNAVGARDQDRMLRNVDELACAGVQSPEQRGRDAQRRIQSRFVIGEEVARSL
jgi:hypothetical protein